MSKINFQESWLGDFPWMKKGSKQGYVTCILCNKDNIYYASMGRSSLTSHAKGAKHKKIEENGQKTCPIKTYFPNSAGKPENNLVAASLSSALVNSTPNVSTVATIHVGPLDPTSTTTSSSLAMNENKTLTSKKEQWWRLKDSVTESEILWCIQAVMSHISLRSAESSAKLFKRMFQDSSTASEMKLGRTKIAYSVVYGIAPYFKKKLFSSIKNCNFFVLCFDESMNKFAQKQQMDIVVKFWDDANEQVSSRYLSSVFLNQTTAIDILEGLKEGVEGLDINKVMQLSMDGPNVNQKVLRMLEKEISDRRNHSMLNIGSCGLHTVNIAFKTGMAKTTWELLRLFRALYYLFHNSPTRRGIYMAVSSSTLFPLKFCSVRWVENASVAKTALDTLENVKKFADHVSKNSLKPILMSPSFKIVSKALEDKLLRAKIAFFLSVVADLEPFLREFQSESPMVPFLHGNLANVVKKCMGRVVKDDILKKPIKDLDVKEPKNTKRAEEVDIGYGTRAEIRKCSGLKDLDILQFRKDCKDCLVAVIDKLLEKSPLKYKLTEALTFLNPYKIAFTPDDAVKKMVISLEILVDSNLISPSVAQNADREFRELISNESVKVEMKSYTREERLDVFWMRCIKPGNNGNLKKLISLLLPLSHGNASLERGFSVNGELIVENLKEQSLIAQRTVYDAVLIQGGIDKFNINKDLILSMRHANAKYREALENNCQKLSAQEKVKAEKRKAALLLQDLENQKQQVALESQKAIASIDEKIIATKRLKF